MNDKPPAAAALEKALHLDDPIRLEQQRVEAVADAVAAQRMLTHVLDRETDFRHLVEQLPALIYLASIDGADRSLYISPYVKTLGHTVSDWCADPQAWTQALHPDDRERTLKALATAYETGDEHTAEYRMRDANGQWLFFRDLSRRIQPDDGSPAYIQGIALDVSDMEASKAALRESEAYRRSLFEQLSDGVLLIGEDHQILDANPQALAMLGCPEEQRTSGTLKSLLVDLLPEGAIDHLLRGPRGQIQRVEWDVVRADGSHLPVEVGTRALDDGRHLAVLRDITEQRSTQRALLTHQLELSELTQQLLTQEKNTTHRVAQALHDNLGQTLAVARLNLELMLSTSADGLHEDLFKQCRHIAQLLEQAVLDVRHVLGDLRPPLLEEQGLAAALDNETHASQAPAGVTDVLLEVGEGLQQQRWPSDVEYSAFMVAREAIVNARLHAQATLIRVVLEGNANSLRLDVIDDGKGISAELRKGRAGHLGVVGMRERAISIGARFSLTAVPGGGTQARLCWEEPRP